MPSADQHRNKADSNRRFLASIDLDDFPDWVVVAAFYTAVHLVELLRAALGEGHSTAHDDRLAYVQHRHPNVHTSYHVLQNASMLARYQSRAEFFAQFQSEDVREKIVDRYLSEIERYVEGGLSTSHLMGAKTGSAISPIHLLLG